MLPVGNLREIGSDREDGPIYVDEAGNEFVEDSNSGGLNHVGNYYSSKKRNPQEYHWDYADND